ARHAPARLRWAIAGRSKAKLSKVRDELAAIDPRLEMMDLLVVDAADRAALTGVAERTRVVITTVGPYLQFGEPLVAACAASGTGCVYQPGGPGSAAGMWLAPPEPAVASGARIAHACGFDSTPPAPGPWFTVQQLSRDQPTTLRGVVRSNATFSGG